MGSGNSRLRADLEELKAKREEKRRELLRIHEERANAYKNNFDLLRTIARRYADTRMKRSTVEQASRPLAMVDGFARQYHEGPLRKIRGQKLDNETGDVKLAAMFTKADKMFEDEIKLFKQDVVSNANPSGEDLQRMVEGVRESLVSKYDLQGERGSSSAAASGLASPEFLRGMNTELLE
ncbi:hypothetical protein HDE_10338 [Halotydeus destructor]|nr:hypothetical protein HDE_10338 [Halotydeus destructor]